MVGVKGKYKGCNTCRNRRVKCDNTRPFCKKCTDHGRECKGYEQETVFIIGTVDDKGRCSSHPPRNIQNPKKAKTASQGAEAGPSSSVAEPVKVEFSATQPLRPAWDETIDLASVAGLHRLRYCAVHTDLGSVARQTEKDGEVKLHLPSSRRVDVRPSFREEDFQVQAECFVHLPKIAAAQPSSLDAEGICLFLYEQNTSAAFSGRPPWKDPATIGNLIRRLGPSHFQSFPAHHFYTRIYRPNAIFAALLNRTPTHLSSPEWSLVPWETNRHPKTTLDALLDTLSILPSFRFRAERILPLPPSIGRRLKAKDLLANCASIEHQLEVWYAGVEEAAAKNRANPLLYWIGKRTAEAQLPFEETYEFVSPVLGWSHIFYWMGEMVLYGLMQSLLEVIFESTPAVHTPPPPPPSLASSLGASPASSLATLSTSGSSLMYPYPDLPANIEPSRYRPRERRKLAANICRSLDWGLGLGQPDLLAVPLYVVGEFYESIRGNGDGELERMWCTGFRARLEKTGMEMEVMIAGKGWIEVDKFG